MQAAMDHFCVAPLTDWQLKVKDTRDLWSPEAVARNMRSFVQHLALFKETSANDLQRLYLKIYIKIIHVTGCLMETLKIIAGVALSCLVLYAMTSKRALRKEFEKSESCEAPTDHQTRWHIRHLREDIHTLTILVGLQTMFLLGLLLYKK